jgi:hypothetical protein
MGRLVEARPEWISAPCCVGCDRWLTEHEIMYSNGVCPYCGYVVDSTVCDVTVRAAKWVWDFRPKWWQFWKRSRGHWEFRGGKK